MQPLSSKIVLGFGLFPRRFIFEYCNKPFKCTVVEYAARNQNSDLFFDLKAVAVPCVESAKMTVRKLRPSSRRCNLGRLNGV